MSDEGKTKEEPRAGPDYPDYAEAAFHFKAGFETLSRRYRIAEQIEAKVFKAIGGQPKRPSKKLPGESSSTRPEEVVTLTDEWLDYLEFEIARWENLVIGLEEMAKGLKGAIRREHSRFDNTAQENEAVSDVRFVSCNSDLLLARSHLNLWKAAKKVATRHNKKASRALERQLIAAASRNVPRRPKGKSKSKPEEAEKDDGRHRSRAARRPVGEATSVQDKDSAVE